MQTDHYTTLGVHDGATQAELDAAYAFWSRRYERRGRQSVEQLRALELAYSALSDEETRAAHDRSLNGGVAAAIACARCGRMDGELCVSVFAIVGSFLIWGRRIAYGNVWCRRCTRIAVFRANAVTTLLGWWGFGFIDAADALWQNTRGGVADRPPAIRAVDDSLRAAATARPPTDPPRFARSSFATAALVPPVGVIIAVLIWYAWTRTSGA